jgi:hypothetical protein
MHGFNLDLQCSSELAHQRNALARIGFVDH